eukprot:246232-Chlamydomonas_euryale.AAC.1
MDGRHSVWMDGRHSVWMDCGCGCGVGYESFAPGPSTGRWAGREGLLRSTRPLFMLCKYDKWTCPGGAGRGIREGGGVGGGEGPPS